MAEPVTPPDYPPQTIAILGMSGRFPGAASVEQYWANLIDGVESLTRLSRDQLVEAGVSEARLAQPNYVPVRGLVPEHDRFDAAFFGYSPREAELMDPQQRLFLQHCYLALNDAGYPPRAVPGSVGVYAGATRSTHPDFLDPSTTGSDPRIQLGNEADNLAARVAHKLGLRGPCLCVHTACSSSLVALHLAVQSLLVGDCDVALAGGVSVDAVQNKGYLYQAGGILSSDGHCRAFDVAGEGTVGGGGVGVLVLRRLSDALADNLPIQALIRGTAVNNDGADRVGYTAPSMSGQAAVIADALAAAEVEAETIGLIEAHGTATAVGDPIEIAALHQVFRPRPASMTACALGSVKTNIGHLDAASGIAGMVKAALSVREARIAPTLHFTEPNPLIDFDDGPFVVNTVTQPWPAGRTPRRAGVSSFGIGGTNAHVVLEQPPEVAGAAGGRSVVPVFAVSGRTPAAADTALEQLRAHLGAHPQLSLQAAAYTLAVGRDAFEHRRVLVGEPAAVGIAGSTSATAPRLAFVLSGDRPDQDELARLLTDEPAFRAAVRRCAAAIAGQPAEPGQPGEVESDLAVASRPAVADYALTALLGSLGVAPQLVLAGSAAGWPLVEHLRGRLGLAEALAAAGRATADDERIDPVIEAIAADPDALVVELGSADQPAGAALAAAGGLPHRLVRTGGSAAGLAELLARAWLRGVPVDWTAYYGARTQRVSLPGYPFASTEYPVRARPPLPDPALPPVKHADVGSWFWTPIWHQTAPLPRPQNRPDTHPPEITSPVLAFVGDGLLAGALVERLGRAGRSVVIVEAGASFQRPEPGRYRVRPEVAEDYQQLLSDLGAGAGPITVLHAWAVEAVTDTGAAALTEQQRLGMLSLAALGRAVSRSGSTVPIELYLVTTGVYEVTGHEQLEPGNATVIGPCRVLPQEQVRLRCRLIDVSRPADAESAALLAEQLAGEIAHDGVDASIALRGHRRWVGTVAPLPAEPVAEPGTGLRRGGVYLITGGTGRLGLLLAEHLAKVAGARLILLSRSVLPREDWTDWLSRHQDGDPGVLAIRRLQRIEQLGAQVLTVPADLSDEAAVRAGLDQARARFGPLDGIIHAAGDTADGARQYLHDLDPADFASQLAAKVTGTLVLDRLCASDRPDFVLVMSSISVQLGGLRLGSYAGANAFLDCYAQARSRDGGTRWLSVQWDAWLTDGEVAADGVGAGWQSTAITPAEGLAAADRIFAAAPSGVLAVSTTDLPARIRRWVGRPRTEPNRRAGTGDQPAAGPWPASRVAALGCELLGVDAIAADDSFFALGGDSLISLQLMDEIQQEFGVVVSLATFFEEPTVAGLAQAIRTRLAEAAGSTDGEDIARQVAQLSDEQVAELLSTLAGEDG